MSVITLGRTAEQGVSGDSCSNAYA